MPSNPPSHMSSMSRRTAITTAGRSISRIIRASGERRSSATSVGPALLLPLARKGFRGCHSAGTRPLRYFARQRNSTLRPAARSQQALASRNPRLLGRVKETKGIGLFGIGRRFWERRIGFWCERPAYLSGFIVKHKSAHIVRRNETRPSECGLMCSEKVRSSNERQHQYCYDSNGSIRDCASQLLSAPITNYLKTISTVICKSSAGGSHASL